MKTSTVFEHNRTQAVRLPAETRFPKHIKKGNRENTWKYSHNRSCR